MFLQPIHLASPPALIAECRDAQKDAARRRAGEAASELGCTPESFTPFDHDGNSDILFTCLRGSEKIILKAHIGNAVSLAGWREPLHASLASQRNLGAPTYSVRKVPGVMASRFLQGKPLQAADLRKADFDIVSLAHELHESISTSDAQVTPQSNRNELFKSPLEELAKSEVQKLLGEKATASLSARLSWLQGKLEAIPYEQKFINGDIHPGNLIREEGALRIIDWGAARSDDPLFDLVQMSFTLRTQNSRLLKYLDHYAALSGREATAQEKDRILLQQAVNNIRWYLIWLRAAGLERHETQGMVTRLLDDDRYLVEMPRVSLPTTTLNHFEKPIIAKSLEEARQLTKFFATTFLPPGADITEPLPKHKKRFAYFRANKQEQDWFLKVPYGAQSDSTWSEPAWMSWAADEGFGPQIQPSSGTSVFFNVLASEWLPGEHLNRTTANEPQVRHAVLEKMRQLHQAKPPSHLVSAEPEGPPSYAGGAWNGLDALEDAGIQSPLSSQYLRDVLIQVLNELDATPVQQVICHRDTHPRNMFFVDGKALFIDWDWAGWDDSMRDPARFFTLSYTPLEDLRDSLADYLGRAANLAELRHLQLVMLATEIDFYCANQADSSPVHRSVTERAERIQILASSLGLQ